MDHDRVQVAAKEEIEGNRPQEGREVFRELREESQVRGKLKAHVAVKAAALGAANQEDGTAPVTVSARVTVYVGTHNS